jgi:hypothetical protein
VESIPVAADLFVAVSMLVFILAIAGTWWHVKKYGPREPE